MPRRMAFYDYTSPAISPEALSVSISVFGGFILVASGILFFVVLIRGQMASRLGGSAHLDRARRGTVTGTEGER